MACTYGVPMRRRQGHAMACPLSRVYPLYKVRLPETMCHLNLVPLISGIRLTILKIHNS